MASGYLLCAKIYYSCRMFLLGKVWCSSYDSIFGQMPVSRQPVRASCCAGMIEENSQEKASCQTAAVGRIVDSFIYDALHDHQNDHQDQAAHIILPETAAVAQSDIKDRAYDGKDRTGSAGGYGIPSGADTERKREKIAAEPAGQIDDQIADRADDRLQYIADKDQAEHIVGYVVETEMEKHGRKQAPVCPVQDIGRICGSVTYHELAALRIADYLKNDIDDKIDQHDSQIGFPSAFYKGTEIVHSAVLLR